MTAIIVPIISGECKTTDKGTEYMGTMSTTELGYTCQYWNVDTPHKKDGNARCLLVNKQQRYIIEAHAQTLFNAWENLRSPLGRAGTPGSTEDQSQLKSHQSSGQVGGDHQRIGHAQGLAILQCNDQCLGACEIKQH